MKDQALYLEADEDITSAIDKLAKASGGPVQIVVPKRSALLQSIINLKLLKKAAEGNGQKLVLVTTDKVSGDLAARIGLAVAPSLGASAVVGKAAPAPSAATEDVIEADDPSPAVDIAAEQALSSRPAAAAAAKAKKPAFFRRQPVTEKAAPPPDPEPAATGPDADEPAAETASKAKVPNFGRMQRRLLWVALAVILVVGYLVGMSLFERATVTLYASGNKVVIDTNFTVDPNQTTSNISSGVLAGQTVTFSKDLTGNFTATGTQDAGTKAGGQVTLYNNYDVSSHTLVAGTRLAAPDGKIFVTTADVTIPGETLSGTPASIHAGQATVAVTASDNGDSYNEAPAKYTVVAYSGAMQADIYGQGAQMAGGTTRTVTVVSQKDIDNAETAALTADKIGSQRSLDGKVPSGYVAIGGSTGAAATNITSSPAINTQGTSATLSVHVTYTELAVKQTDYQAFINARELAQVGSNSQIYDDGISSAQVASTGKDSSGRPQFSFSAQAYSGSRIDTVALAGQIAGKKYGDATDLVSQLPGVQRNSIILKPSWATSLPHSIKKIKISIQVASSN